MDNRDLVQTSQYMTRSLKYKRLTDDGQTNSCRGKAL